MPEKTVSRVRDICKHHYNITSRPPLDRPLRCIVATFRPTRVKGTKSKNGFPRREEEGRMVKFDPKKFLERVGTGKTITSHEPGEIIMKQGSPADHVFYLQAGKATETVTSEHGKD